MTMPVQRNDLRGVVLDNVSKSFGKAGAAIQALERVDLAIGEGEFVAVVGPSGCGKSTLLRMISRLSAATTGTISVFGDTGTQPPRDMSIVFQNHVLLPWRTVIDNVLFPAEMTSASREQLRPNALDSWNPWAWLSSRIDTHMNFRAVCASACQSPGRCFSSRVCS